jgi:hypothetical protein
MVSIVAFDKPCSGAKTLGWEHSKKVSKMLSKNLGVVSTPLRCFQK